MNAVESGMRQKVKDLGTALNVDPSHIGVSALYLKDFENWI